MGRALQAEAQAGQALRHGVRCYLHGVSGAGAGAVVWGQLRQGAQQCLGLWTVTGGLRDSSKKDLTQLVFFLITYLAVPCLSWSTWHLQLRQEPQGTSDFRVRSQGPCRLGRGESGLVLG